MARALWLILPVAASARPWAASDLSSPDRRPCGQGFRICDTEGYLTSGIHDVENAINALESDFQYPGCGAYEMGVVVVSGITGGGDESSTAIFAKSVMDMWGVGKRACNNGIVLAMAIQDRQVHIATGGGTREFVPDVELERVIDRMKPLVRNGQYAGAAVQCVSDIRRILSGESMCPVWPVLCPVYYHCPWALPPLCGLIAVGIWLLVLLGGIFLLMIVPGYMEYQACKRKLTAIERKRAQARAQQYYEETSCAICLEEFSDTPRLENELLVCGHKFHRQCIDSWGSRSDRLLTTGTSCPICRPSTSASAQGEAAQPLVRAPAAEPVYEDEYRFRISRARCYYPRYVSHGLANRWSRPGFVGTIADFIDFVRSYPV